MTKYCGIDPGLSGSICIYDDRNNTFNYYDGYILKINGKSEYDIPAIKDILKAEKPEFICIERQHAMPKQGVSSMFKIGYGYGIMLGIINALEIPYMIVQAHKWQSEFFSGGDTKDQAYRVATQRYPQTSNHLRGPKGGIKDGRADATLICIYGKQHK